MRRLIIVLAVLAPLPALAQPADGSGTGSASVPAAAGSAATGSADAAGSGAAVPAPTASPVAASRSPEELRQICAEAMNADPTFAESIAMTVNEQTLKQHKDAANAIAKNERHVIFAYAAMWVLAALFLVFLWRRQQHLKGEIVQLRRDLDAAAK